MRLLPLSVALTAVLSSSPLLADVDPVLTVNGVSGDNNTSVTVVSGSTVQVTLTGTPGASFALLYSASANVGPAQGFFLAPWSPPQSGIRSPIHFALDGVGSSNVAAQLGLPASNFVPSPANPLVQFGAAGTLPLAAALPLTIPLSDFDAAQPTGYPYGPGQPFPYPLQEPLALFLQVVSLDTQTAALRIGNGIRLDFLGKEYGATVALSTAVDSDPDSATLGEQQSIATVVDDDLGDATLGPATTAPDFAGTFGGMTDVWMIQLAGPQEAVATAGTDLFQPPDEQFAKVQSFASSLEFGTGEQVARDNENPEFPRLRLPGGRQLFHWRNGGTNPPTWGFGVLFEETGTFRNLVPAAFGAFSQNLTRSPWEVEVGVTPDGDRAVIVLDRTTDVSGGDTYDRLFLLNLEEGGTFTNGWPIIESTPGTPALTRRIYEESITFSSDGAGGWAAWVASASALSTSEASPPNRLWRVELNAGLPPVQVIPNALFPNILTFDEILEVSGSADVLCLTARKPSGPGEDVYSISNITPVSFSVRNITQFPTATILAADQPASDGISGYAELSYDGTVYAGARAVSVITLLPFVARTDGSDAGAVVDIVRDISSGGAFDLDDFPTGQGFHLTDDGDELLFHQGRLKAGPASDASDLFVFDVGTQTIRNLTRTLSGAPYDQNPSAKLNGPWDLANAPLGAPSVDYGGSFLGPDRRHRFLFADRHLTILDSYNLYAVEVKPTSGTSSPSFRITNVTGKEFEPTFGTPPPTTGAPDIVSEAGFFSEPVPGFVRPRRVGGDGPLKDSYFFTARLASPAQLGTDVLFMFDAVNPGPALQVTSFGPSSQPFPVPEGTRLRQVTPNPDDLSVAFVLHQNGSFWLPNQELMVQRLVSGAAPVRVPNPGSARTFDRVFTGGSIHWLPGTRSGLVFSSGTKVRAAGLAPDAVSTQYDEKNPIDATPWFFSFADPTNLHRIVADPPAGSARAAMIWSVR